MKKISTLYIKDLNDLGLVINVVNPENEWVFTDGIPTRKFDGTSSAIINGILHKRYDAKLIACKEINIGDRVAKKSGKKFNDGKLEDIVIDLVVNENDPKKRMGALLKNSNTVVSLEMLLPVGKFLNQTNKKIPENAVPCQEPDEFTGHWPHWIPCDRNDNSNKYHFLAFDNMTNIEDGTYELIGKKIQGNPEKISGHVLVKHGSEVLTDITDFSFESLKEYLTHKNIEGIVFHNKFDDRMCKIRKTDFNIKR